MDKAQRGIKEARQLGDYRVWLRFDDGRQGIVDLSDALWGDDLAILRDPAVFATWRLDAGYATLVWDEGYAFAPDDLYDRVMSCH